MLHSKYYPKQMDISGSRVLITGATSGIGKCCAFRFLELQCQLILVGRNESKLQALGVDLEQEIYQLQQNGNSPGRFQLPQLIRLDVTELEKIEELAGHIGPVDIIINNAGTNLGSDPADQVKQDNMIKMVLTNYSAPMAFVAAFSNMMKQKGNGHIVNVCSTAGDDIYSNSSVYCSTKAALHAYTEAARHDLVDTPIRVTSISPGLVDTPLHEKKAGDYDASRKAFDNIVPLYPEDIADQIVYVCTRPKHVQVADVATYATNQSHSGVNGIKGVARVGPSLGASIQESYGQKMPNGTDPYGRPDSKTSNADYHSPRDNYRGDYHSPRENYRGNYHSPRENYRGPSSNGPYYGGRDGSPMRNQESPRSPYYGGRDGSPMRNYGEGNKSETQVLQFNNGSWSSNPLPYGHSSSNDRYNGRSNGGPDYPSSRDRSSQWEHPSSSRSLTEHPSSNRSIIYLSGQ